MPKIFTIEYPDEFWDWLVKAAKKDGVTEDALAKSFQTMINENAKILPEYLALLDQGLPFGEALKDNVLEIIRNAGKHYTALTGKEAALLEE